MKKTNLLLGALIGMAGMAITSCQNHDEFSSFAKKANWENRMGGAVAQDQDWNMAQALSVSVSANEGETYSIYAPADGRYKLVGRFSGLSGEQELKFVALKGTDKVLVSNGNKSVMAKVGEKVDFMSARSAYTGGDGIINIWESTEKGVPNIPSILDKLPEELDNVSRTDLAKNFFFNSLNIDEFTIFPVYSMTTNNLKVGVYYYDELGNLHKQYIWGFDGDMRDTDNIYRIQNHIPNAVKFTLPHGTDFGFFSERVSMHNQFFSQSKLNPCGAPHVATYEADGFTYVGFEDYCNKVTDLNDLVFYMYPCPTIVDEEPLKWIVTTEDMGSTGDYDFNDVTFEVSYVAGETHIDVTPLAAGGNLRSVVYFKGQELGEIHALLGAPVQIVNTREIKYVGETIKLTVPAGYTLADDMGGFTVVTETMGGSEIITAPKVGEIPQMLLVPSTWKWPLETISIEDAYPLFKNWNGNVNSFGWTVQFYEDKVIDRK